MRDEQLVDFIGWMEGALFGGLAVGIRAPIPVEPLHT